MKGAVTCFQQHTSALASFGLFLDIITWNWGHKIILVDGTDGTCLRSRFIAISEEKNLIGNMLLIVILQLVVFHLSLSKGKGREDGGPPSVKLLSNSGLSGYCYYKLPALGGSEQRLQNW